jgi:hypothetical protein
MRLRKCGTRIEAHASTRIGTVNDLPLWAKLCHWGAASRRLHVQRRQRLRVVLNLQPSHKIDRSQKLDSTTIYISIVEVAELTKVNNFVHFGLKCSERLNVPPSPKPNR